MLDIGTGTGLLAMMASHLGANSTTACEVSWPIVFKYRTKVTPKGQAVNTCSVQMTL